MGMRPALVYIWLAVGCRTESADPTQTNAQLGRCTQQATEEHAERVRCEDLLDNLTKNLSSTREELAAVKAQRAEIAQRRLVFEQLKTALKALVEAKKAVPVTNGNQMSINLSAAALFAPGEASVSSEGQAAMAAIGPILAKFPTVRFMIAGHTDAAPIVKGVFSDNWALSTQRALQVARVLIGAGASPNNLVVAGYGDTLPTDTNDTQEGRRNNRRIEIVLVPGAAVVEPKPAKKSAASKPDAAVAKDASDAGGQ